MKLMKPALREIVREIFKTVEESPFTEAELDAHAKAFGEIIQTDSATELCKDPLAKIAREKLWYPLREFWAMKNTLPKTVTPEIKLDLSLFPKTHTLPPLAMYKDLRELDISGTLIRNLSGLATGAKNLERLIGEHVALSTGEGLGELTNLTELTLSKASFTSLPGLEKMTKLRLVSLSDIPLETLDPLLALPALKRLKITNTTVPIKDPSKVIEALRAKGVQVFIN